MAPSARIDAPSPVNRAALPGPLIESELFGYERGAVRERKRRLLRMQMHPRRRRRQKGDATQLRLGSRFGF